VRKVVQRSPAELEKFKKIVQSALGIQDSTDSTRKDEITLEEFEFNTQGSELTATLQREQTKQFWFQIGQTALYPLLACVVIALLWRVFKRAPDVDIPVALPDEDSAPVLNGVVKNGKLPTRRGQPGVVTVDVLNQLIRENPQNMTQAIRGWMDKTK
jgi:flagellar biosynthesis/type III secretory pathway M-ring protein FliF/YscJ